MESDLGTIPVNYLTTESHQYHQFVAKQIQNQKTVPYSILQKIDKVLSPLHPSLSVTVTVSG